MNADVSEEEGKEFDLSFEQWMYDHASAELWTYWDCPNWVGCKGQLRDGKGHILRSNPEDRWNCIQDWDVNEDCYCVYYRSLNLWYFCDLRSSCSGSVEISFLHL